MNDSLTAQDYEWLFSDTTKPEKKRSYARSLRGESDPEWVHDFFKSFSAEDPTIDKESGRKHTVESMVEELKNRVKLDSISKIASICSREPSLFFRRAEKTNDLLDEMKDYIERHYLKPGHGQSSRPALFEAIKEKFGLDRLDEGGGVEKIKSMIDEIRKEYIKPNPADCLPAYDGTPIPVGRDKETDKSDFLTQNTSSNTSG